MNYRHIYCKIISYAKSQNRVKGGEKETFSRECPDGWKPGRLFRKRAKHKNKTYAGKPVGRTIKD